MKDNFEEPLFREFSMSEDKTNKSFIKASEASIVGKTRISVEEESHDGVKVILKKDSNDIIKEIKFVCSCGQTKSIMLDYTE